MAQARAMDRDALEAVARDIMNTAHDNLNKDGYVAFAVILYKKDGNLIPVAVKGIDNPDKKEHLGRTLRGLARECNFIVVINEAWLRLDVPEEEVGVPIRNHPARTEGICVSAQSPIGEFLLVHKFERDAGGKPLEPLEAYTTWMEGPPPAPSNFQGLFH